MGYLQEALDHERNIDSPPARLIWIVEPGTCKAVNRGAGRHLSNLFCIHILGVLRIQALEHALRGVDSTKSKILVKDEAAVAVKTSLLTISEDCLFKAMSEWLLSRVEPLFFCMLCRSRRGVGIVLCSSGQNRHMMGKRKTYPQSR